MIDVAEAAGVARSTASYVLNGADESIPEVTRQRVLKAAEELGYRVNRIAQHMARRRSGLVGLIIPSIREPFFSSLTATLNELIQDQGLRLVFQVVDFEKGRDASALALQELIEWQVDGMVVHLEHASDLPKFQPLLQGTPTVYFGIDSAMRELGGLPNSYSICIDLYSGTRYAVEKLIDMGHRRFCFVDRMFARNDSRREATIDALRSRGVHSLVTLESDHEEVPQRVEAMMKSGEAPTAFVCLNDIHGLAAFRGIRNAGFSVPEHVSIVSCDTSWIGAYADPSLSGIALPLREAAVEAANLLKLAMSGEETETRSLTIEPQLMLRQSTGPVQC
ncbi:MAG: LacI family DNA-binding transcriptional regulator [Fimbriimonas sp.]|nr:LacI family DNA-binding transcriptional regulator [Fimbriimonas sp.]